MSRSDGVRLGLTPAAFLQGKMFKYFKVIMEQLPLKDPTKMTAILNRMQAEGRRVTPCKY